MSGQVGMEGEGKEEGSLSKQQPMRIRPIIQRRRALLEGDATLTNQKKTGRHSCNTTSKVETSVQSRGHFAHSHNTVTNTLGNAIQRPALSQESRVWLVRKKQRGG